MPSIELDHRQFLAADIGARATTKVDEALADDAGVFQRRDLAAEDFEDGGIFVAHVDEGALGLDGPCGDQHALKKEVRRTLQIVAVLEGPRLALVTVDGQVARTGVRADKAPLLAGREARTAKTAKPGSENGLLNLLPVATLAEVEERLVTPCRAVGFQRLIIRHVGVGMAVRDGLAHLLGCRVVDVVVAQFEDGRGVAAAHAGRAEDTHLGRVQTVFQRLLQLLRACKFAGQRIAYPDGQGGRRGLAFADHVEVGVEGGDFIDFGLRQTHLFGQGHDVAGRQLTVFVLDQVKEFDEQVAPTRAVAQKRANLVQRGVVGLPSLGGTAAAPRAFLLPNTFLIVKRRHAVLLLNGQRAFRKSYGQMRLR